jgi:Zn-dependent protease
MDPLSSDVLALGLMRYIVFLLSTTCHEASHALAAKLGGDNTAFHGGQVTLNPVPHITREPFGMVVVPLLGLVTGGALIGWASAPYDPLWQQRYPRRAAWMSLAGPGANFALVLLAALAIHAGFFAGLFRAPERFTSVHLVAATQPGIMDGVAIFLSVMFSLNVLLGVFNLFPIPPLDGFSAIGVALSEPAARKWYDFGHSLRSYSFLGLLLMWQVFGYVYGPVFAASLQLLYPGLLR